jgi:endoglucanase
MRDAGENRVLTRRQLLSAAAGGCLAAWLGSACISSGKQTRAGKEARNMAKQTVLPRWRGFNVHNMFAIGGYEPYRETDFQWIADWGFDFVRLAVSHVWMMDEDEPDRPSEKGFAEVDRGIELARKHKLHANLDMHTAPGYAYHEGQMTEERSLWKDEAMQARFCHLWRVCAQRYQDIPSSELSFNLLNEPAMPVGKMTREEHEAVIRGATAAVREVSPERLIIADGLEWGKEPVPELADLGIAQSYHFYTPHRLTHYRASWAGPEAMRWPEPTWPGPGEGDEPSNRAALEEHLRPWIELAGKGVGVHAGEGGVYVKTAHHVALAWLGDVLGLLKEHNIGYAVWNFRGPFGILDSEREDVDYEDFHGHKLDRKMLELLQGC